MSTHPCWCAGPSTRTPGTTDPSRWLCTNFRARWITKNKNNKPKPNQNHNTYNLTKTTNATNINNRRCTICTISRYRNNNSKWSRLDRSYGTLMGVKCHGSQNEAKRLSRCRLAGPAVLTEHHTHYHMHHFTTSRQVRWLRDEIFTMAVQYSATAGHVTLGGGVVVSNISSSTLSQFQHNTSCQSPNSTLTQHITRHQSNPTHNNH